MVRIHRFFISIFITSCIIFNAEAQKKITLNDLRKDYTFFPEMIYGLSSMKDGQHYSVQENRADIVLYSYETGEKTETVLDGELLKDAGLKTFSGYTFSDDESKILLVTAREAIYRRSYLAEYFIFDRTSKRITALSSNV